MNTYPNQPFKFRRQKRSDSVFANLTTEQHLQLRQWLDAHTYAEVVEIVAAPAPEGFGIKTHINSLHRYYTDECYWEALEARIDQTPALQQFAEHCQAKPAPYHIITSDYLEQRLMHLAMNEAAPLKEVIQLSKVVFKDRDSKLKMAKANPVPEAADPAISSSQYPQASSEPLLPQAAA